MLTVEEALALVLEHARPLPPASRRLIECRNCRLAEEIRADADQPPFDKSMVDGFALRWADPSSGNRRLKLDQTILAGHTPEHFLVPGRAAAIMTGAPLPQGADAVVMHERAQISGDEIVLDDTPVTAGQNILRRGHIYQAGQRLLQPGSQLSATAMGLLAAIGKTIVTVIPRPRMALIPTGDELVEADQVPGPGQIRNSNSVMLEALALDRGAWVQTFPVVPDDPSQLQRRLREGLAFDVLLVTGGVSVGQRDLVPASLEGLGVRRVFHKVRIKPGKPLWFGIGPQRDELPGTLVFGLPGNPASGLVAFLLFVRPALHILQDQDGPLPSAQEVRLAKEFTLRSDRPAYLPARIVQESGWAETPGIPLVEVLDWAGSADLLGLARAEGLAYFPAGDRVFRSGEIVRFIALR
jgi:molybdopterin molybdotransferase